MKNLYVLFLLFMMGLVGCSSSPKVANEDSDRQQYVQDVRNKLNDWEKKSNDYKGDKSLDVRASINDARAEVRALETASAVDWSMQKDRVQSRLDGIQQKMSRAE